MYGKRVDYDIIIRIIPKGATVLDLGCGDGTLLYRLKNEKNAEGVGIEISHRNIMKCIAKGLNVVHGDLDEGLDGYPPKSFDFVILNFTLEYLKYPDKIIKQMLKIGKYGIVGIMNTGYLTNRLRFLLTGRLYGNTLLKKNIGVPVNPINIGQFERFCNLKNIKIKKRYYLTPFGVITGKRLPVNIFAVSAVYILSE